MHGWILLDKPEGMSSNAAMCRIRKLLGVKTGYIGTLDPFAQGMLPIAVGRATKFIQYVNDAVKVYTFKVKFGEETDTLDPNGRIIKRCWYQPTDDEIVKILPQFVGTIEQAPPIYSAIHIDGERAYKLVKKNPWVTVPNRYVNVYNLIYLGNHTFRCICGRGTYIRSIARDMSAALGTCGYAAYLRREQVSFLHPKHALTIDKVEELVYNGAIEDLILPIDAALTDISAVSLDDEDILRLTNGLVRFLPEAWEDKKIFRVYDKELRRFCGLVESYYDGWRIKPLRMIIY